LRHWNSKLAELLLQKKWRVDCKPVIYNM
jgi:hypothetical protein